MQDDLYKQILEAESRLNDTVKTSLSHFKAELLNSTAKFSKSVEARDTLQSYMKAGMEKEHNMKESLLTNLMEITDYRTIYNMVAASLIPLTILLIVENISKHGQLLDFETLSLCFRGGERAFMTWWILAGITYFVLALVRVTLTFKLPVSIWLPIHVGMMGCLVYVPCYIVKEYDLGFGCRMGLVMQGIRMAMKSHSYLRNKLLYCSDNKYKNDVPNFISRNSKSQTTKTPHFEMGDVSTEVKRFTYFFIAPTLIYRDQYTLIPRRRFSVIFEHFFNFFVCMFYSFMLYVIICKPLINEVTSKQLSATSLLLGTLKMMLPSMMFLIFMFFGFLHSWQNAWAELTRFPDRTFYLDWWNSVEFGEYYRKWNIVVHDWLYYYVYLDLLRFVFKKDVYRKHARVLTFLLSAVFHQLVIIQAIGFLYPVLFLLFTGPGIILIENKRRMKIVTINLFFWIQLYLGTSMIFMFYLIEYLSRDRFDDAFMKQRWGIIHQLIPRTLYLL